MENENLTIKQQREIKRQQKIERKEMRNETEPKKRLFLWLGVIAAVIAVVVGMVAIVKNSKNNDAPSLPTDILESVSVSDWIDGNKNASTTLIEYGDFQCPACGSYYPIVKELKKEFKDDVKFVFRHFPLPQHANALPAALAAEAAGMQGKFFEMHDMLYENQDAWSSKGDAKNIFIGYAEKLGLNMEQFKADMESKKLKEKILESERDGVHYGVDSTPTFFLNNQKITPRSLKDFKDLINNAKKPQS